MSRSFKKAVITISKVWTPFKERNFRHRLKQACHDATIDFDPDRDFNTLSLFNKTLGSGGTRIDWEFEDLNEAAGTPEELKENEEHLKKERRK